MSLFWNLWYWDWLYPSDREGVAAWRQKKISQKPAHLAAVKLQIVVIDYLNFWYT